MVTDYFEDRLRKVGIQPEFTDRIEIHLSCSADTYVSLGGSKGCADQLTNWDGTQKDGLGALPSKKWHGLVR